MEYPGEVSLRELPEVALDEGFGFGLYKSDHFRKYPKLLQSVCTEMILCTEAAVSETERKAAGQVHIFIKSNDLICCQLMALFCEQNCKWCSVQS